MRAWVCTLLLRGGVRGGALIMRTLSARALIKRARFLISSTLLCLCSPALRILADHGTVCVSA